MNFSSIHQVIESAPYELSTAEALEMHVTFQLKNQEYDFATNKALLKSYQVNTEALKVEFITSALVLAIMHLPNSDFLTLSYLIPTKVATNAEVTLVKKCADLLERGQFGEFWANYVQAPQALFGEASGFVDAVRAFILSSLRNAFRSVPRSVFQQHLGLNESSISVFCNANPVAVENLTETDVILSINEENQNRRAAGEESLRMEDGLRVVEYLRA